MKLEALEKHVERLANLPETDQLIVSCYVNLEDDDRGWRTFVPRREKEIVESLVSSRDKADIRSAFNSVKMWLNSQLHPESRGAAFFAYGGERGVFIPLQFEVPLPNEIAVDTVPHLYQLVRMKDSYHRYILLLTDSRDARIYEVNLGKVSHRVLIERPEVRSRLGREWTKLHYKRRRRENNRQYIQQKLDVLDKLFATEARARLILAGDQTYVDRVAKALPRHIAAKVVGRVSSTKTDSMEEIVLQTLQAYVRAEELESLDAVDRLFNALQRNDMAIVGVADSLRVVSRGQADTLILCHDQDLGSSYICPSCFWVGVGEEQPGTCEKCGAGSMQRRNVRQELVRLAQTTGCDVETVTESEELLKAGGVGCFLRYTDEFSGSRVSPTVL